MTRSFYPSIQTKGPWERNNVFYTSLDNCQALGKKYKERARELEQIQA